MATSDVRRKLYELGVQLTCHVVVLASAAWTFANGHPLAACIGVLLACLCAMGAGWRACELDRLMEGNDGDE